MYKNFGIIAMYLLTVTYRSELINVEFVPAFKKIMVTTDEDSKALYEVVCEEGDLSRMLGTIEEVTYKGSEDFPSMAEEISSMFVLEGYEENSQVTEFLKEKLRIVCEVEGDDENDMTIKYVIYTNRRRMLI